MSSDEKVFDFPKAEITSEEKVRPAMAEAKRLASLAPGEWRLWIDRAAERRAPAHGRGIGLDLGPRVTEDQRLAPVPPSSGEEDPEDSVPRTQLWTSAGALQGRELLPKRQVFKSDGSVTGANQADGSKRR